MTAIILAGGLGTRLRSAVPELPKCMAPIQGKPFVHYVIKHLREQGVTHFIFALGYKHEYFLHFLQEEFPQGNYSISTEDEPLGTGGAIRKACTLATTDHIIATNGDTLFKADISRLMQTHLSHNADCTLSLKPMLNFDRYGVVAINTDNTIRSFQEKKHYTEGLINAGLYALNKNKFLQEDFPDKFSFEKDYLEKKYSDRNICGVSQDVYFIDIGIPEDYEKAGKEL